MDIDEILAKTYALYDPSAPWSTPPHLADAAPVAHGWYMLVRNFGRAALKLEESKMEVEGMPLRRSMIEHGLALTWLAASPEKAMTALARKTQYTASKLQDAAGDNWNVPAGVFESIAAPVFEASEEDKNVNFTPLAIELGHTDLRVVWMHQSAYCHPSLAGAQTYLTFDASKAEPTLLATHEYTGNVRAEVALLLLIASDGFNRFIVGCPWTAALDDLSQGLKAAVGA